MGKYICKNCGAQWDNAVAWEKAVATVLLWLVSRIRASSQYSMTNEINEAVELLEKNR